MIWGKFYEFTNPFIKIIKIQKYIQNDPIQKSPVYDEGPQSDQSSEKTNDNKYQGKIFTFSRKKCK